MCHLWYDDCTCAKQRSLFVVWAALTATQHDTAQNYGDALYMVKLGILLQLSVDFVLPDSMLHIAGLLDVTPSAVELMQLHCHLTQILQVICLQAYTAM